ncbi:hypothetical protein M6D93_13855 [Jatrophihabitans telluris]|uniref:Uncharacterized protein n=1 Tax=Jatrophihabitans telluris TaxID=2038343 RepID=A0ABY4QUS4_9ACTN|nr:hypothetical protein [Jatrophihabitans telluris]UQX87379.1 hypothetical protein M6D93_13855 [Jatrophihabitans telluris]
MITSTPTVGQPAPADRIRSWMGGRWSTLLLALAVTVVLSAGGIGLRTVAAHRHSNASAVVPQSQAMQQSLGIRFSRVAVVADGGLITLSYVVLDPEKAQRFQADSAHPPKLTSESRSLSTTRVSLMKQGHTLTAGQTYYLVYENTRGAIRPGEKVTITDGSLTLAHFPVLR